MFRSIRARLTLWYALILGFVFLVSDVILYQGFRRSMIDSIDHTLYTAAERVEDKIDKLPPNEWLKSVKRVEQAFLVNRLFIQLLKLPANKEGNIELVARSGVLAGNIPLKDLWEEMDYQAPSTPFYMDFNVKEVSPVTHPMRLILFPVTKSPQEGQTEKKEDHTYLIQVGISLKKMFTTLKNFSIILVVSGPILLFISILGGYFILTKALRPVHQVVQAARKITTEDLSHRIETKNRKDEIGQLIITFNQMITRLERSVKKIKQFSSDVSHDLRTPLTVIRGEIEVALRKERETVEYKRTLINVQEEAEKLEHLIDNLLFLSRIDERIEGYEENEIFSMQPTSLDEILLSVFEKTHPLAQEKGILYVIGKMTPLSIRGNAILLNRLIVNLADNALKYTPGGETVEIRLEETNKKAVLTIRDTGIGIPRESLPYIFDRFYRVDQARSSKIRGSGLGLSIVKKISDIHHASINVESEMNKGTTVQVIFPRR